MARTVTISDETAAAVDAAAARTNRPVDELVDEALRREFPRDSGTSVEPFVITGPFVRSRPGTNFNFDKIEALLDEVEGPWRK
jgi:hypothetical protein